MDVYLFPAVVGGGLGDIEEVLAAGRALRRAGFRVELYRRPGRPLPRGVDGPWAWPALRRTHALHPRAAAALTVSPAFGLNAAPGRPGPLGREGPWAHEASDIERTYGSDRTLHLSLEEFARTLTVRRENLERLREGGVRARALSRRGKQSRAAGDVERFRAAFREFRAFDRPNVLHLFATFAPDSSFAREMPEAVQTGPLWSRRFRPSPRGTSREQESWVWYASPASAERIAPAVVRGLKESGRKVHLTIRSPRPWRYRPDEEWVELTQGPQPSPAWSLRFREASVRVVTGSRTLLEALEVRGPFLYFNGVLGRGGAARRHRPEKLLALVRAGRANGVSEELLRDLRDFSRARRVREVVRRAAVRKGAWRNFPSPFVRPAFAPPFDDAGRLIVRTARRLARSGASSQKIVRSLRSHAVLTGTAGVRRSASRSAPTP